MKVVKKLISGLFIGGILVVGAGCSHNGDKEKPLRNVILAQVTSIAGEDATDYPGIVEEGASVSASFMADGKISRILVKEGDRVRKGQLLAYLDDADYKIGMSQLEAQYGQMTKEKERMDAMFEKHNIAPNDYEKFQAGYEQLRLQLEMMKRKLDYTRLYSPSDGYIATAYMHPGELTGAGTPVFNIIDDTSMKASVDLPVSVYLQKDKIVSAKGVVPGIEGEIPLTVASFTPDPDNNMLYRMKLNIPSSYTKALTSGMNISVWIYTSDNAAGESMVPSRALFDDDGKTCVWLFNSKDSTISRKEVTIEGSPMGKMSVVKGLSNGEQIVETGVKQLYEGEKVKVLAPQVLGR